MSFVSLQRCWERRIITYLTSKLCIAANIKCHTLIMLCWKTISQYNDMAQYENVRN